MTFGQRLFVVVCLLCNVASGFRTLVLLGNGTSNSTVRASGWPPVVATPHMKTSMQIIEALEKVPGLTLTKFAVNLGAGDGASSVPGVWTEHDVNGHADPTFVLFRDLHFAGLAVEGNAKFIPALNHNVPWPSVKKVQAWITPVNVVQLMQQGGAPTEFDYYKLDIDAYDCAITHTVLQAGYRPRVIHMEVNPEFPYPAAFGVNYADHYSSNLGSQGFYGCSVTMLMGLVKPFGYEAVAVAPTHDVIFMRSDLVGPAGLEAMDEPTAAAEEATCCAAPHFVAPAGYATWDGMKANPTAMIANMQAALQSACVASQGGSCTVPFTISTNPQDFVTQLNQIMAAKAAR